MVKELQKTLMRLTCVMAEANRQMKEEKDEMTKVCICVSCLQFLSKELKGFAEITKIACDELDMFEDSETESVTI